MSCAIVGIKPAGEAVIPGKNGPTKVGILQFMVSINEGNLEPAVAFYNLHYQDYVFKALGRMTFVRLEPQSYTITVNTEGEIQS